MNPCRPRLLLAVPLAMTVLAPARPALGATVLGDLLVVPSPVDTSPWGPRVVVLGEDTAAQSNAEVHVHVYAPPPVAAPAVEWPVEAPVSDVADRDRTAAPLDVEAGARSWIVHRAEATGGAE